MIDALLPSLAQLRVRPIDAPKRALSSWNGARLNSAQHSVAHCNNRLPNVLCCCPTH